MTPPPARHAVQRAPSASVDPQVVVDSARRATERGDHDAAIAAYLRLLDGAPRHAALHNDLGNAYRAAGRPEQAEKHYLRAAKLDPRLAVAHYNLGIALLSRGEAAAALRPLERALKLRPGHRETTLAIVRARQGSGQTEGVHDHIASLRARAEADPSSAEAWRTLGLGLANAGDPGGAGAALDRAIALAPHDPRLLLLRGLAHEEVAEYDGALAAFEAALRLDDSAEARFYRGCTLLRLGRWAEGWRDYEARWEFAGFPGERRDYGVPRWDGSDPSGRTILVHAEQGFGDAIHFVRYAAPLAERGARVVLACEAPLRRLLEGLPFLAQVVEHGEATPAVDAHVPLLSLPHLLGLPEPLSAGAAYLDARHPIAPPSPRADHALRVGLCWAGSTAHAKDLHRSLPLDAFAELLASDGVEIHSLQKGGAGAEAARYGERVRDSLAPARDFLDTARIVAGLDLVITVDTAVAHLAAALGKPVWILLARNPDWRWGVRGDATLWYPSVRLFRQGSDGAWAPVVARVVAALAELAGAPPEDARPSSPPTDVASGAPVESPAARAAFELGVKHHLAGETAAALAAYRRAIELMPELPEAHNNLGVLVRETDLAAATECFREAARMAPGYLDGFVNLGLALQQAGRLEEAAESFRRAVEIRPDDANANNNLGAVLRDLGRAEEAEPFLAAAVRIRPEEPSGHINLGNVHLELGRVDRAIDCYQAALRLDPASAGALNNLGGAYRAKRRFSEAIHYLRRALDVAPDFVDALHNLSVATPPDAEVARANEAILRAAVERNPGNPRIMAILATALHEQGRYDEACEEAKRILELDPDNSEALTVVGISAADRLEYHEAIRCYDRALARSPHNSTALWNRTLAYLAIGDYERGWPGYENRWRLVHFALDRREFPTPTWDGSPLDGRTILLYTEQGLGDAIQFIRFARVLKERWSVRIVVQTVAALVPLLQACDYVDLVVERGGEVPAHDVHCALLSLPWRLGTRLETIPAEPYLTASPRPITASIRDTGALKVGLVWGGGAPTPSMAWRSVPLALFRELAAVQGVQLYALQKGDAAAELEGCDFAHRIVDLGPQIRDFNDTAAAIAALDLVISIDTSVAHLAGGLGVPLWTLLIRGCDWRWLADRDDSPWYPSARLFRQEGSTDWAPVVARVTEALRSLASGRETGIAGAGAPAPAIAAPSAPSAAPTVALPAADTDEAGRPAFTLNLPLRLLATPDAFAAYEAELVGGGVDAELRALLRGSLAGDDVFVDLRAGWGHAALSAATSPAARATVVAVTQGEEAESILLDAIRTNPLRGTIHVRRADQVGLTVDSLVPPASVEAPASLYLRIGSGAAAAAALAGAGEWLSSGRLACVAWEPCGAGHAMIDEIIAGTLQSLGYTHLRMVADEDGPLLVDWRCEGADGPVLSLSAAAMAEDAADAAAPAAPFPAGAAGPAPRLGVDWQIGTSSGWGVYGYNLARRALATGRAFPVLFTPPDLRSLAPERAAAIEPSVALHRELATQAAAPGSVLDAGFPVLRALGNGLMGAAGGMTVRSGANVGVVFFEDTLLPHDAIERGRRFARIVAGSSWNAEVLRANGLTEVVTCLQGVDRSLFHPGPAAGLFGDRFVVFSGGKLEYRKGQDIVVAAFREFHRRHPESLLVVAWHNHWPATMQEIGLKGHVQGVPAVSGGRIDFAGWLLANGLPVGSVADLGELSNAEMPRVLREAHAALFPNRCEGGTNLVAMECMATGVPTILSANTGHLDLIEAANSYPLLRQSRVPASRQFIGTEGWGESSIDEILDHLEAIYSDREEAGRRGEAGARTLASLSWDSQIDRLLEAVDDLL